MAVLWWRPHYFCHVRLGVNFMSWSNFCVLVWLPLSWRDFITLSDIIGYVVTWWMTSSLYGGHVNLGMIFFRPGWNFRLGVILFVLVLFYTLVLSTESWYDFSSPCLIFRFSAILFDLVLFHILVRSTASWYDFFSSWCDFVWFGVISYLGKNN